MKTIQWTDEKGWRHTSLIRDNDSDDMAPHGIPHDPPDVNGIDWDVVKRDLHNELAAQGLLVWTDLNGDVLGPIAIRVLVRQLRTLYGQTRTH